MHHETIARHFLWRRFSFPLIAQRAVVVHRLPFRLLIRAMGHKHTTFKQQSFLSIGLSSHTYLTLSLTIINHPHPPLFSSLHTLRAMGGRFQFDLFSFSSADFSFLSFVSFFGRSLSFFNRSSSPFSLFRWFHYQSHRSFHSPVSYSPFCSWLADRP